MRSPEEFAECWGKVDLFQFPPELLRGINIPEEAKIFLQDAGLPLAFVADRYAVLLPVRPVSNAQYRLLDPSPFINQYRLLAMFSWCDVPLKDENIFLAIAEGKGEVHVVGTSFIDPEVSDLPEDKDIFVNSSVQQFAEAILACREHRTQTHRRHFFPTWNDVYNIKEESRDTGAFEQKLRTIDRAAMTEWSNWWVHYITLLREGDDELADSQPWQYTTDERDA